MPTETRGASGVALALGARGQQLAAALVAELAAVGALAGLLAAAGAALLGGIIAKQVFQLELSPDPLIFPLASAVTAVLAAGIGWAALGKLLKVPPAEAWRG